MAADDRTAILPYGNWAVVEGDLNLTKSGFRPISTKFTGSFEAGVEFSETFTAVYVKNEGYSYTPTAVVVHHKTYEEVIAVVNNAAKTSHPLRCIHLESYMPYDTGDRRYSAVFIENTGVQFKHWYWWFGASVDFILSETDQHKTDKPNYPIRLVHISPHAEPVGKPWGFDIIAVSNTGADSRWWWWNYNMTRPDVQDLLNAHAARNPRVYQLANGNVSAGNLHTWTAILVESGSTVGWYEQDQTHEQLSTLVSYN